VRQGGLRTAAPGAYGVDSKKARPKPASTKATAVSPRRSCAQPALTHLFTKHYPQIFRIDPALPHLFSWLLALKQIFYILTLLKKNKEIPWQKKEK